MRFLGIIPARYSSSRFPGKPLAVIAGKTMIERVYRQASDAVDDVVVATDDERIFNAVRAFGGNVEMTSDEHENGTSRCYEVFCAYSKQTSYDAVVNIQGDEPLISPLAIKGLTDVFDDANVQIATLVNRVSYSDDLLDPNLVKVVRSCSGRAMYFSRSLVPFVRNREDSSKIDFFTHLGIYAFRADIFDKIIDLPSSATELSEQLEQNRWIENDFFVQTVETEYKSVGVDVPEDILRIEKKLGNVK